MAERPAGMGDLRKSSNGSRARQDKQPARPKPARPTTTLSVSAGAKEEEVALKKTVWKDSYIEADDSVANDFALNFVRTGERPQNHLRGADLGSRFSEYPKLSSLLVAKHKQLASKELSIPPTYLLARPEIAFNALLASLPPYFKFDSILVTPPPDLSFEHLCTLELERIASNAGFIWLWVGTGQLGNGIGLERGRELMQKWGYRRCEDIVWLKTNKKDPGLDRRNKGENLLVPSIEHCLMGIRGTIRRSTDPWLVHCNVDTDVITWEGDEKDPDLKPPELQSLVENFCLGTRRLHLYGSPRSLRRGWITVGKSFDLDAPPLPIAGEESVKWKVQEFSSSAIQQRFPIPALGTMQAENVTMLGVTRPAHTNVLPFSEELDALRPKSPPLKEGVQSSGGLGRGRGAGLGVTRSTVALSGGRSRPSGGPPSSGSNGFNGAPRYNDPYAAALEQSQYLAAANPYMAAPDTSFYDPLVASLPQQIDPRQLQQANMQMMAFMYAQQQQQAQMLFQAQQAAQQQAVAQQQQAFLNAQMQIPQPPPPPGGMYPPMPPPSAMMYGNGHQVAHQMAAPHGSANGSMPQGYPGEGQYGAGQQQASGVPTPVWNGSFWA